MMGRQNFTCNANPTRTADLCLHTKTTPCRMKGSCEYDHYKKRVLAHPIQILNYHYFLTEANYVGSFSDYPIIVCDEADTLESILTSFIELKISKNRSGLVGPGPTPAPHLHRHGRPGIMA
jgi:Rad3-related DNA helicase